jgi:hypothetical protein
MKTRTQTWSDEIVTDTKASINSKFSHNTDSSRVYQDIDQTSSRFEDWVKSFLHSIDVDIMPGP